MIVRSLVLVLACGSVAAQTVVVPAGYASREAGARGFMAGFQSRFRQQVLVRGDLLSALYGKSLASVSFRRDALFGWPFPSSVSQLKVQVSHAATRSFAPSPVFASNHGVGLAVVFDGPLVLPSSTGASQGSWTSSSSVTVPFSTAFAYGGGDLCLELEGTPGAGAKWSVDFVQEDIGSQVIPFGAPCGWTASRVLRPLSSWARYLAPGGDFYVSFVGQPLSSGFFVLGAARGALPLDAWGAAGCSLWVQPQAALPVGFGTASVGPDALVTLTLSLPAQSSLLAARFFGQGINFETVNPSNAAGIVTTNGLEFVVGAMMPPASLSMVQSADVAAGQPLPAGGNVYISRGPVMRFDAQ